MTSLAALGPWAWLILGLVLVGLETLAPGVFFVWLGIAAILTGVADWAFALSWQTSFLLFAALAIVAVAAGRMLTRHAGDSVGGDANLNRRAHALVGRTFLLDRPISGGEGRIRVDDTVWRVVGPDLASGTTVRVVRLEGATLVVEAS